MRGAPVIAANGQVAGLLGIFQRLVGSKINDVFAFELVQALYEFLPMYVNHAHTRILAEEPQDRHAALFADGIYAPSESTSEQAFRAVQPVLRLSPCVPLRDREYRSGFCHFCP